jgi:hypothetical protein
LLLDPLVIARSVVVEQVESGRLSRVSLVRLIEQALNTEQDLLDVY